MSINVDIEFSKGDKVVAKKKIKTFGYDCACVGDIFIIEDVFYNYIRMASYDDESVSLTIDKHTFYECFEMVEEPACIEDGDVRSETNMPKSISRSEIVDLVMKSEFDIAKAFDSTTIVAAKLPNGFVIVESSSSADPEKYNKDIGIEICIDKIVDRVWAMETYRLKSNMNNSQMFDTWFDCDENECDKCAYTPECLSGEEGEEFDWLFDFNRD